MPSRKGSAHPERTLTQKVYSFFIVRMSNLVLRSRRLERSAGTLSCQVVHSIEPDWFGEASCLGLVHTCTGITNTVLKIMNVIIMIGDMTIATTKSFCERRCLLLLLMLYCSGQGCGGGCALLLLLSFSTTTTTTTTTA